MKTIIALVLMITSEIGSFVLCDKDINLIKNDDYKFLFISFCLIVYGLGMHLLIESIA